MNAVSLHEVTQTRDCKLAGCEWEAEDARGRYAGLCGPHKRAAIDQAVAQRRANPRPRPVGAGGELIAAARDVVAATVQLEKALTGVRQAQQRRLVAGKAWRESVATLLATAKPHLGNEGAA